MHISESRKTRTFPICLMTALVTVSMVAGGCQDSPTDIGVNESRIQFSTENSTGSVSVTVIEDPDAYVCSQAGFIGFEEYPDQHLLSGAGSIAGVEFTTTGGFTWRVADSSTGNYNGKYPNGAYMLHGDKAAWLGESGNEGRIDFVEGNASYFSLLASVGNTSIYLAGYDDDDNLLATAGPSGINVNTGTMAELLIERPERDMAYVVVYDSGNFFVIDSICTDAPGVSGVDDMEIDIDIHPGSDPNSINLQRRGVTPVAILGSTTFDVMDVDVASLAFGSEGGPYNSFPARDLLDPDAYADALQDVDGDGLIDLVLHFPTQDAGFQLGDTSACVVGTTTGGTPFQGCDAIRIVR
jgi:hypothetical protein